MGASSFVTLDADVGSGVDTELEVKRSRFLTRLRRVTTEDAARAVIEEQRRAHFDARHHCSAFVLGPDARTARSSDDGEPAGTAGVPMLSVLQRAGLTDVVAVVTRYFGGVKLGAGGLVRAYSDAVAGAVEAAGRRQVTLHSFLGIDVDLAEAGLVEEQLRSLVLTDGTPVRVLGAEWAEQATVTVAVPRGSEPALTASLAALSAGRLVARPTGEGWTDSGRPVAGA